MYNQVLTAVSGGIYPPTESKASSGKIFLSLQFLTIFITIILIIAIITIGVKLIEKNKEISKKEKSNSILYNNILNTKTTIYKPIHHNTKYNEKEIEMLEAIKRNPEKAEAFLELLK